ncbi:hypothetical protein POTOM_041177 [Populus tomentosa]|uniref:Uncharacterized protein n=1 Tax=Populus tomentosa TaxID=118781 RepID=A0A8X7YRF9_POPTO|nr:hypothetical protein POTOM_041177 [Populus tomentosa]
MYEEVFETFDSMGLQENLLMAIFVCGSSEPQPNISNLLMSNNAVCGNMYRICYNNMPKQRIWEPWNTVFSPCACPLPGCNYAGSSKQLLLGLWKAF